VSDFWRPLYSKDAVVDGKLSVQCYLDALAGAYGDWERAGRDAGHDPSDLVRRCYHVPYGKMARKAHRHLASLRGLTEAEADASFDREVAPSLRFSAEVGNVYTGSLYLALASLLDADAHAIEGRRVGLFSYGSGSCAEYFAGTVLPGAAAHVARLALSEPLEARRRLDIPSYEAVRRGDVEVDRRPVSAADTFTDIAFAGVSGERRVYVGGQMSPSTST
jgi:hydroxymethylglutaryl-CoA synthase